MSLLRRRLSLLLLLCLLLTLPSLASERKVFFSYEVPPLGAYEDLLHVYVADLLGADSMLLVQGEHSMLLDMGVEAHAPRIHAMLQGLGFDHITHAFNTHPHGDHLGGLPPLLEVLTFGSFYTAFPLDLHERGLRQRAVVPLVQAKGIPIHQVSHGDVIDLGAAQLTVFHQPQAESINGQSAMLQARFGDSTILFTADVDLPAMFRFGKEHDLKSDILKAPHHGLGMLSPVFLDSVDPEYAFFTHGSANNKRMQVQLSARETEYSFATWGIIHLSTDGEVWRVDQDIGPEYERAARGYGMQARLERNAP